MAIRIAFILHFAFVVYSQGQGIEPASGLKIGTEGIYRVNAINIGGDGISDGVSQTAFVIPYYQWLYTTLSDGGVSSWVDGVNSLTLTQATGTKQPTKSSTGIVFDGGDYVQNVTPANLTHSLSIDMILKIADTNAAAEQWILAYRIGTGAELTVLGLKIQTHAITTSKKIGIGYNNGAGYTYNTWLTTDFPINSYFRLTVLTDSLNKQSLYVNGVLKTALAGAFSTTLNTAKIILGCSADSEAGFFSNGEMRAVLVYNKVLSAAEILQNGTAFTERGYY